MFADVDLQNLPVFRTEFVGMIMLYFRDKYHMSLTSAAH
jgi:phosphate starvation-inducible membrane PsiE